MIDFEFFMANALLLSSVFFLWPVGDQGWPAGIHSCELCSHGLCRCVQRMTEFSRLAGIRKPSSMDTLYVSSSGTAAGKGESLGKECLESESSCLDRAPY